ncbi:RagB/SusD family nutrient uptake outer membrane protein [Lewinella sp. IMCC34191]|uniref:RagB/SusD family nutrient uptake outer membrane protein n=1 Tax=Lewinella sp. IMCC34191 TaxID=2259172 RepID=UPI000E25D85A|nr:RagB/SusD family nutrient uptake outer membrane protein [Lewinella sp. IMCC34191]
MKLSISALTLGMGLFCFSACSDEFLEQTPQQSLSIDNAVEDLNSLNAAVNGLYSRMQGANIYGWDLPLIPDLRADNAYISSKNAGRFLGFDEYGLTDGNGRVASEWSSHYAVVVNASNIITRVPETTFLSSEQDEANQLLGEAYAIRGLNYWNLLRLFAPPYSSDGGASAGVPFNNEGTTGEIVTPARESVAAGYAQVTADLEAAIGLMTEDTDGRFSVNGARALLAKVKLYEEDWTEAEAMATSVIESGDYTLYASADEWFGSWGSVFGSEDIFALSFSPTDNSGTNSIGGIIDQDGYGDVLATEDLFEAYSETDYRRQFLIRGDRADGEKDALFPEGKYPEGETGEDYVKILRLSDIYLIRAEARAELDDESGAIADLTAVAAKRDAAFSGDDLSGDDLIDAILDERRKELAFEGDRVFDLMRRQRSWTKYRTFETEEVSWNNPQLINPIPRAELDNNPNITQNDDY